MRKTESDLEKFLEKSYKFQFKDLEKIVLNNGTIRFGLNLRFY